ncbi:SirB2 family protein [Pontibacter ruber]|uniref:SirB2 family protein n=1 Tax=Pontibacter ruber TaxID=1343895 RepID=A0ABW5CWN3_9BACT|nr:SirB2 family protein [Pontibacter ruber]
MPITALLHAHVLVLVLFLLLFTVKVVLLLLNKRDALAKVRTKTKVADVILGVLILITGGWLVLNYTGGLPSWLIVKIVLVLAAIPLGIIGLKRENKPLAVLALFLFLYVYGVAETNSLTMQKADAPAAISSDATSPAQPKPEEAKGEILSSLNESSLTNGKSIYVQVCATCHGANGEKGLGGAANLAASTLSLNQRKDVIHKGRGMMPGFGQQLSEQEIEQVAAYTMTLKK